MSLIAQKKNGVGVIIRRDSLILLGKRKSKLGFDTWGPPGGLLEPGEALEDAAHREVLEETGLLIRGIAIVAVVENFYKEKNHFAQSIMVEARYESGIVQLREPDKCEQWAWFEWSHLPRPLFAPFNSFVNQKYLELVFN